MNWLKQQSAIGPFISNMMLIDLKWHLLRSHPILRTGQGPASCSGSVPPFPKYLCRDRRVGRPAPPGPPHDWRSRGGVGGWSIQLLRLQLDQCVGLRRVGELGQRVVLRLHLIVDNPGKSHEVGR